MRITMKAKELKAIVKTIRIALPPIYNSIMDVTVFTRTADGLCIHSHDGGHGIRIYCYPSCEVQGQFKWFALSNQDILAALSNIGGNIVISGDDDMGDCAEIFRLTMSMTVGPGIPIKKGLFTRATSAPELFAVNAKRTAMPADTSTLDNQGLIQALKIVSPSVCAKERISKRIVGGFRLTATGDSALTVGATNGHELQCYPVAAERPENIVGEHGISIHAESAKRYASMCSSHGYLNGEKVAAGLAGNNLQISGGTWLASIPLIEGGEWIDLGTIFRSAGEIKKPAWSFDGPTLRAVLGYMAAVSHACELNQWVCLKDCPDGVRVFLDTERSAFSVLLPAVRHGETRRTCFPLKNLYELVRRCKQGAVWIDLGPTPGTPCRIWLDSMPERTAFLMPMKEADAQVRYGDD